MIYAELSILLQDPQIDMRAVLGIAENRMFGFARTRCPHKLWLS